MKKLSKKQQLALYNTLRTLDIRNDYDIGDELRLAFGVEVDKLRSRRKEPKEMSSRELVVEAKECFEGLAAFMPEIRRVTRIQIWLEHANEHLK